MFSVKWFSKSGVKWEERGRFSEMIFSVFKRTKTRYGFPTTGFPTDPPNHMLTTRVNCK